MLLLLLCALLPQRENAQNLARVLCEAPPFEHDAISPLKEWRQHSKGRPELDILFYAEFASAFQCNGDAWISQEVKLLDVFRHVNTRSTNPNEKPVLIDVGCQYGQEARYALDTKVAHKVYSFEINNVTASRVAAAFPFHGYQTEGRYVLQNAGVSSKSGTIQAHIYSDKAGIATGGTLGNDLTSSVDEVDRLKGHTTQLVDVDMVALDDLSASEGLDFFDLIKIDTDGHEMNVFEGMAGILSAKKVFAVLWEYSFAWSDSHHVLADGIDVFQKYGYKTYALGHTHMLQLDVKTARKIGKLPFSVVDMVSVIDNSALKKPLVAAYNANICNSVFRSSIGVPERGKSKNSTLVRRATTRTYDAPSTRAPTFVAASTHTLIFVAASTHTLTFVPLLSLAVSPSSDL
jgi:FkbM family methyltransferase